MTRRLLAAWLSAGVALAIFAGPASAFWTAAGMGLATAPVDTLAAGNQPSASVSSQTVTVTWAQSWLQGNLLGTFTGGGYTVRRYAAAGGAAVTPGTSCGATITGTTASLSCAESSVAPGSWQYTVTPLLGSWTAAESTKSVAVTVAPAAPTLTSATAQDPAAGQTTGAITLSWGSVSTATGYNVYRRTSTGSYDFTSPRNGSTPVTATTYTDPASGLTGGATYDYVVRSVAGSIEGISSNERAATVLFRASAPTSITATPGAAGQIAVGWTGASGATGYNVYRRTSTGSFNYASPVNGATPLTGSSYTDTSTTNATTYRYVVRSVTPSATAGQLESADSAESPAATADATSPTAVSLTDPGPALRGTVTLSGTATDSGSGVASVRFQYAPAGTTTWATGCTATTSPYSCSLATNALSDGLYDMRVLATDVAGNTTTSASVANRRVDNTVPAVSMTDPGAYLRGSVTLTATGSDTGSGLASLRIERAPTGTTTWTTVCTVATPTASCPLNTTTLAAGGYDVRATATDVAGNTSTSTVTNRVVDNTAPTATDIQTTNVAGGTAGKPESGDVITYTFSEAMAPASILAGWSGAARTVVVRVSSANPNVVTIYDSTNTTQLALGSFVSGRKWVTTSTTFNASSMVLNGSTVAITLGTASGATVAVTATTSLQWTTSTAATDLAGNPLTAATVTETGALDLDF
jgi:hypothetical protein